MPTAYSKRNLSFTVFPGKYRRMTSCESWVSGGPHSWAGRKVGEKMNRCSGCGKTKDQAREPKPITLEEALKGN